MAASEWVYLEGLSAGGATRRGRRAFTPWTWPSGTTTRIAFSFSDRFVVEAFGADLKNHRLVLCRPGLRQRVRGGSLYRRGPTRKRRSPHYWQNAPAACVTCSERGSYVHLNGEQHYVPAQATRAVDMTGAGDIYAAGVLYGISSGAAPERAARLGARVAYDVVRQMGARLEGDLTGIAAEIFVGFVKPGGAARVIRNGVQDGQFRVRRGCMGSVR